jgi:hypothetical protein
MLSGAVLSGIGDYICQIFVEKPAKNRKIIW